MKVYVKQDSRGKWRWKAVAANGRVDNASEQGYRSKWYAKRKALRMYPGASVTYEKAQSK